MTSLLVAKYYYQLKSAKYPNLQKTTGLFSLNQTALHTDIGPVGAHSTPMDRTVPKVWTVRFECFLQFTVLIYSFTPKLN